MSEERYYSNVREIREETDAKAVNELLKEGWELLAIREKSTTIATADSITKRQQIVYVLGRTEAPKPVATVAAVPNLDVIPWKKGAFGDWAFSSPDKYTKLELTEEQRRAIEWLREVIEREGEYDDGVFTYRMGRNKDFITRRAK